jgi:hypothetical protein
LLSISCPSSYRSICTSYIPHYSQLDSNHEWRLVVQVWIQSSLIQTR